MNNFEPYICFDLQLIQCVPASSVSYFCHKATLNICEDQSPMIIIHKYHTFVWHRMRFYIYLLTVYENIKIHSLKKISTQYYHDINDTNIYSVGIPLKQL